jgi:hypothetical protein
MVPDGLEPGIDMTDELVDAADIANGEVILEVTGPELIGVGKKESLAAGS